MKIFKNTRNENIKNSLSLFLFLFFLIFFSLNIAFLIRFFSGKNQDSASSIFLITFLLSIIISSVAGFYTYITCKKTYKYKLIIDNKNIILYQDKNIIEKRNINNFINIEFSLGARSNIMYFKSEPTLSLWFFNDLKIHRINNHIKWHIREHHNGTHHMQKNE